MALQSFRPARCCRNCARRMWTKGCCTLPAMWRSATRCMDRVLKLSKPNTFLVWFPRSAPDIVKDLKTNGSGKLPSNIQKRKTKHLTASANDAFATIRITAKDSTEECYDEALDYLCAVLSQEEFPRSYSVEFRGKEKIYLPIPGLPKKGVNQLFACAVQYPSLHPAMERYARLAMREFEWYQNLADEACAMPGTFAVFGGGSGGGGGRGAPPVKEYLSLRRPGPPLSKRKTFLPP